jgi:alkaline phosphatase D
MPTIGRRQFLQLSAALGASLAWGAAIAKKSKRAWKELSGLYSPCVASDDPDDNSVLR